MIRLGLIGSEVATITVGRSAKRGRYRASDLVLASRLHKHVVRAHGITEQLASLKGLNAGLVTALDQSPAAMLLVDERGRLLHANAAGERLLARGDVVRAAGGYITAARDEAEPTLSSALARAACLDWQRREASSVALRSIKQDLAL